MSNCSFFDVICQSPPIYLDNKTVYLIESVLTIFSALSYYSVPFSSKCEHQGIWDVTVLNGLLIHRSHFRSVNFLVSALPPCPVLSCLAFRSGHRTMANFARAPVGSTSCVTLGPALPTPWTSGPNSVRSTTASPSGAGTTSGSPTPRWTVRWSWRIFPASLFERIFAGLFR